MMEDEVREKLRTTVYTAVNRVGRQWYERLIKGSQSQDFNFQRDSLVFQAEKIVTNI